MKKMVYIIISVVLFQVGCREVFDPTLDRAEPLITVEGLITDKMGNHKVRLFYTRSYNDENDPIAISGALVYVEDNERNTFYFFEGNQEGVYTSPEPFKAQIGHSYKLFVETADGVLIESKPQPVLPGSEISSIKAFFGELEFLEVNSYGDNIVTSYEGLEVFIDIPVIEDQIPRFRYEPRILQLILAMDETGNPTYFWQKYGDRGPPNVNLPGVQSGEAGLLDHYLTFVPFSRFYYKIPENHFLSGRYLLIKGFRLNQGSYNFYKQAANQLSAEGHLFDPISAQIPGNLICISDPEEIILGLFEVSSESSETYSVYADPENDLIEILPFPDLNYLPPAGEQDSMPYFWRWY